MVGEADRNSLVVGPVADIPDQIVLNEIAVVSAAGQIETWGQSEWVDVSSGLSLGAPLHGSSIGQFRFFSRYLDLGP